MKTFYLCFIRRLRDLNVCQKNDKQCCVQQRCTSSLLCYCDFDRFALTQQNVMIKVKLLPIAVFYRLAYTKDSYEDKQ